MLFKDGVNRDGGYWNDAGGWGCFVMYMLCQFMSSRDTAHCVVCVTCASEILIFGLRRVVFMHVLLLDPFFYLIYYFN